MASEKWKAVTEVSGELEAELLRGLLEAQGIPVILNQEGAGRAYGLAVGALGAVQILVPESAEEHARKLIDDYFGGRLEESNFDSDDFED